MGASKETYLTGVLTLLSFISSLVRNPPPSSFSVFFTPQPVGSSNPEYNSNLKSAARETSSPILQLNPYRLRQHAGGAVGGFFIVSINLGYVLIVGFCQEHGVHFDEQG